MGPVALFDKSFLQSLSFDEAAVFDALYSANICPIFFVETLADLKKEFLNRDPKEEVAKIAAKTPSMHSYPNVHHEEMCLAEMMGQTIELRGVPAVGQGIPVRQKGKVGIYHAPSPESRAFSRWQHGQFHEVEHEFAAQWRSQLQFADLRQASRSLLSALNCQTRARSFDEALSIARTLVRANGNRFAALRAAWTTLRLDKSYWPKALAVWKSLGGPPLPIFAPYASYVFTVDVFFHVCLAAELISPDRPSNRIDVAYLYYLPFSMMFVSSDKLHSKIAPLFLNSRQAFVNGVDLKTDLSKLNVHYAALDEDVRIHGLYRVASRPPADESLLTYQLWTQLIGRPEPPSTPKSAKVPPELLAKLKAMSKAAKAPSDRFTRRELDDPDYMTMERRIPMRMGRWRLLPEGVESSRDQD